MRKALATVTYDVFNREDWYIKVTNEGFLDRTKIFQELLKLDLWELCLEISPTDKIHIFCDRIHSITLYIAGHTIPIDCSDYYRMYYDKKLGKPVNIDTRKQPSSTIERKNSRSWDRAIWKIPYKRKEWK